MCQHLSACVSILQYPSAVSDGHVAGTLDLHFIVLHVGVVPLFACLEHLILYETRIGRNLCGNEFHLANSPTLLVKKMLFSTLHCKQGFLIVVSYKIEYYVGAYAPTVDHTYAPRTCRESNATPSPLQGFDSGGAAPGEERNFEQRSTFPI